MIPHIALYTGNIQNDVWDHPREVATGGWGEEFDSGRARWV